MGMIDHIISITISTVFVATCTTIIRADGTDNELRGIDTVADVQNIPVPDEVDSAYYLKIHNSYRSLVSRNKVRGLPKPIYMPDMEWDLELADHAMQHAKSCDDYSSVTRWGEILMWSDDKDYEPLHEKFNQIEEFLKERGRNWWNYADFAQMITANSRRLGCARHYCEEQKKYFTVCNYWSRYLHEYQMPYSSDEETPYTVDYCMECPLRFYRDVANDTRIREKANKWDNQRPGTPLPPKVLDSSYFLNLHNAYRGWLAEGPPLITQKPLYMAKMEWDPVLENAARRYAEACEFDEMFQLEDTNQLIDGVDAPNTQIIHRWFDEYAADLVTYEGQIGVKSLSLAFVWSTSRSLGCWQTRCTPFSKQVESFNWIPRFSRDETLIVCSYHPKGNIMKFYPFMEEFNYTYTPEDRP